MALILAFIAGFALGWRRAGARGGSRADRVQWGAAHGFGLMLAVMIAALLLGFLGVTSG